MPSSKEKDGDKKKSSSSKSGSKSDSSSKSKSKSDSSSRSRSKSKEPSSDGSKARSSSKDPAAPKPSAGSEPSSGNASARRPSLLSASMEFEAGMMFSKFDKQQSGLLDRAAFVNLFKEIESSRALQVGAAPSAASQPPPPFDNASSSLPASFQAGQLFERYSRPSGSGWPSGGGGNNGNNGNGNGGLPASEYRMTKSDFERFVADTYANNSSGVIGAADYTGDNNNNNNASRGRGGHYPPSPSSYDRGIGGGGVRFGRNVDDQQDRFRPNNNDRDEHLNGGGDLGNTAFRAGELFERFGDQKSGVMGRGNFEKLVSNGGLPLPPSSSLGGRFVGGGVGASSNSPYQQQWREPMHPEYTHYNETTGVPLTSDGASAHVATGQIVSPLPEAYSKRLGRLSALAASTLAPRRSYLSQLRHLVLQRSDEIAATAKSILKETSADAAGVVERLAAAERDRQATLQQQLSEVEAELEGVDRLVERITRGCEAPSSGMRKGGNADDGGNGNGNKNVLGMVGFIQLYPELSSAIERVSNRYVNGSVSEVGDDLPREMAERNEVVRKCDKYEQALSVKDQMIWNMLKDKEKWEEKLQEERDMNKEYAQEMSEWLALTNSMSEEINRLREDSSGERERMEAENNRLRRELEALRSEKHGGYAESSRSY